MSELSKNQLTTENNNSFPNNNTGFITPTLLRTFNQNMIDSLVDEQQYNVDSASFNARINTLDPSGSAQAILTLQIATASLNAYTQSQNSFNASATASIVALQNFSSSLDTTYATDAQLSASASTLQNNINTKLNTSSFNAYTASFTVTGFVTTASFNTYTSSAASGVSASINSATQSLSSSVAAINATQLSTASFNTYTASQSTNISASLGSYLLSQSFNTYTQSNDSKVNSLIAATGSYATLTQLSASASTLQNNINAKVDLTTYNPFTQSVNTNISQINARVSSSATTGSNTFIGNQIVSGNVNIAGNITADSASFLYVKTIFETASVIYSSGSNQFGDELIDVQTLSGSVKVQGSLTVNGVPVQTSSFDASGYLLTSSFNTYTQSAASGVSASINSATQSLSSSIATTTSGLSSSIGNLSSSVAVTTNNLDLEVNQKLDTGSFNTYTQSNDTKVNALIAQTGSYAISSSVASALNAFSSSVSLTYATETELSASASTLQNGINSKVETSTFNTYTSSQSSINTGLTAAIQTRLTTASFNSYTQSNDSKVNSLIAATGSYITSAQTSSMSVLSSSFAVTASFALNAGASVDTGSLVTTASFNQYTQSAASNTSASINSATQSLSSSIATTTSNLSSSVGSLSSSVATTTSNLSSSIGSLSSSVSVTTAGLSSSIGSLSSSVATTTSTLSSSIATTTAGLSSSIGSLSSSVATTTAGLSSSIGQLSSVTGSYATTGSNTFRGNQTISGSLLISGNITATSASFQYVETVFETASVIYSSGSNQFGDASNDTQTLFGRVDVKTGPLVITGSTFVSGNITLANGSDLVTHHIQAAASNGIEIQNNSGNNAILVGAGGSLGSTFYGQINATTISASGNITANLIGTASYANKALTASFAENVSPTDVSMFVSQSTFNSYTSSNDGKVNSLIAATSSYAISSSVASITSASQGQINSLINATSSYANSASVAAIDAAQLFTSSFNTYTQSISSQIASIGQSLAGKLNTSSLSVSQNITGSIIISGSSTGAGGETLTLIGGTNPATDLALHILSGSVEITTPQGNGAHFYSNAPITSSNLRINGTAVIKDLFVSGTWGGSGSGSLFVENSITASNLSASNNIYANTVFANVFNGTASFATTASFALNASSDRNGLITTGSSALVQAITGSLIISGATFNGKIEAPSLSIGTTTLDVLFESTASTTASTVVSEIDFTRLGAGATGDLTGIRLQTLSGSDTAGDTLLSRITTGVNRHTTTAMTGSVVNTILQSTWATGSGGARVTYGSTITANAQSASATITIAAGNGSANFAGGTASLQAGRVNIGTTNATITSTGSFTHLGSLVTSQGITINAGGITATAGAINGDLRVNGVLNITGSNPTIQSGSFSGSLISNLGDIYTGSNNANFIVTLGSASMASLLAGSSTNVNTIYFVLS
jgi:hypothetical protein